MADVYETATTLRDTYFTGYAFGDPEFNSCPGWWPSIPTNQKIGCVYYTWAVLYELLKNDGITPSNSQRSSIYVSKWKTRSDLTLHSAVEQELDGIKGPITAIVDQNLGDEISISDIKKGDFIQWWRKIGGSTEWNSGHSVIAANNIVESSPGNYQLDILGAHITNASNPDTVHVKTQDLTGFKVFAARYTGPRVCETTEPVLPPYTGWVASPYGSKKSNNEAKFYVDGEDFMKDLAYDLRRAKHVIYITDWWMEPDTHLIRNGKKLKDEDSLYEILIARAKAGVQVRIMLYYDYETATALHPNDTENELEGEFNLLGVHNTDYGHPNIRVSVHRPDNWGIDLYSHHQKTVIIDNYVGYVGGLDICYGRWDNSDHSLYASPELFPAGNLDGLDSNKPWSYYGFNEKIGGWGDFRNPGIPDVCDGIGVRSEHPRQPWHDIHSRIVGESAVDLANNFRERWEFQRDTDWVNEDALVNTDGNLPFDFPGVTIWENRTGPHNTPIQILRSIDAKTADVPTETDIMQGYRNIIDEAEHYLYIENQFFISNFEPSSTTDPIIVNDIATKIAERVIRAIDEGKKFKVYIVVPVHSEGIISSDTKGINNYHTDFVVQGTIRRQLETVYRGSDSMIGKIAQRLAGTGNTITQAHLDGVGDYLRIYNLRTYGADIHSTNHSRYFPNVTPMTNQVYVHSKMMIADDRVALIGSANINDRSLLGDRDSEIAAMFAEGEPCWGVMNGEYYPCSKKVREFRIKIWKELLGENDVDNISDPVSETCFTETWKKIADDNTAIYEDVFPDIASNKPAQYTPRSRNIQYWRGEHAKKSQLFGIRGFVTNYPWQHWLKDMVPTVLPTYVLESTYDILIAMNGPNIGVGSEEDWLV